MRHHNRRGFTLIELLVVISIVVLLISILLPSLAKSREAARGLQCLSALRQLGMAVHMYAFEFDDRIPPATDYYNGSAFTRPWHYRVFDQLGVKFTAGDYGNYPMRCPSGQGPDGALGYTYVYNANLSNGVASTATAKLGQSRSGLILKDPGKVGLILESVDTANYTYISNANLERLSLRHGNHFNNAFYDAHAESISDLNFTVAGAYSQYSSHANYHKPYAQYWAYE